VSARRLVGLISDTHGEVRPEALRALSGVEVIVHAGDIGPQWVLEELSNVAPVHAVRGNTDRASWGYLLPESREVEVGPVRIHVLHDLGHLDLDPAVAGIRVVVHGHSHQPAQVEKGGVLYVNPGSAGPRRFSLPVSVARLVVEGSDVRVELVTLG
jgi:hypothetical protein